MAGRSLALPLPLPPLPSSLSRRPRPRRRRHLWRSVQPVCQRWLHQMPRVVPAASRAEAVVTCFLARQGLLRWVRRFGSSHSRASPGGQSARWLCLALLKPSSDDAGRGNGSGQWQWQQRQRQRQQPGGRSGSTSNSAVAAAAPPPPAAYHHPIIISSSTCHHHQQLQQHQQRQQQRRRRDAPWRHRKPCERRTRRTC